MSGIKIFFLLCITLIYCNSCISEKDEIKKTDINFRQALVLKNGNEAVSYLDSESIEYFSAILSTCKSIDSSDLSSVGPLNKLIIFCIKLKFSPIEICRMDGVELFSLMIDNGLLFNYQPTDSTHIDSILIQGDFASANLIVKGSSIGEVKFQKEKNEVWKVKFNSYLQLLNLELKQDLEKYGTHQDIVIVEMAEYLTNSDASSDIWRPVCKEIL